MDGVGADASYVLGHAALSTAPTEVHGDDGDRSPVWGRELLDQRMAQAWKHHPGPKLVVLSGNDYTAKEFVETTTSDALWRANVAQANVSRLDVAGADHTFSDPAHQRLVEERTVAWLVQCLGAQAQAAAPAQDHAHTTPKALGVW